MKKTQLMLLTVFVCLCLSACGKSLDMEKLISSPVKEAVIRANGEETRISDLKMAEEVAKAVKNSVFRPASASAYDAPGAQTLSVEIITETGSVTVTYPYFRCEGRVYGAGADSTGPLYAIMSEAAAAEASAKVVAGGDALPRCFRIEGKTYYFYGKKAGFAPEGKDPETGITVYTGANRIAPSKDGESNFEEAVGAKCVLAGDEVFIKIGSEWYETVSEDTMKKMAEEAREQASREAGSAE